MKGIKQLIILLVLVVIAVSGWWVWQSMHTNSFRDTVQTSVTAVGEYALTHLQSSAPQLTVTAPTEPSFDAGNNRASYGPLTLNYGSVTTKLPNSEQATTLNLNWFIDKIQLDNIVIADGVVTAADITVGPMTSDFLAQLINHFSAFIPPEQNNPSLNTIMNEVKQLQLWLRGKISYAPESRTATIQNIRVDVDGAAPVLLQTLQIVDPTISWPIQIIGLEELVVSDITIATPAAGIKEWSATWNMKGLTLPGILKALSTAISAAPAPADTDAATAAEFQQAQTLAKELLEKFSMFSRGRTITTRDDNNHFIKHETRDAFASVAGLGVDIQTESQQITTSMKTTTLFGQLIPAGIDMVVLGQKISLPEVVNPNLPQDFRDFWQEFYPYFSKFNTMNFSYRTVLNDTAQTGAVAFGISIRGLLDFALSVDGTEIDFVTLAKPLPADSQVMPDFTSGKIKKMTLLLVSRPLVELGHHLLAQEEKTTPEAAQAKLVAQLEALNQPGALPLIDPVIIASAHGMLENRNGLRITLSPANPLSVEEIMLAVGTMNLTPLGLKVEAVAIPDAQKSSSLVPILSLPSLQKDPNNGAPKPQKP